MKRKTGLAVWDATRVNRHTSNRQSCDFQLDLHFVYVEDALQAAPTDTPICTTFWQFSDVKTKSKIMNCILVHRYILNGRFRDKLLLWLWLWHNTWLTRKDFRSKLFLRRLTSVFKSSMPSSKGESPNTREPLLFPDTALQLWGHGWCWDLYDTRLITKKHVCQGFLSKFKMEAKVFLFQNRLTHILSQRPF